MPRTRLLAVLIGFGLLAAAIRWRRNPSACPYNQRLWIQAPHPLITRRRLQEILAPSPGERVLEVGPGTGYYALPVAEWLRPDGTLEVLDVQQEMLDHTLRRAQEGRLENVVATHADARAMPYEDGRFDGAYLVTVLGEIPDQGAALRELHRVVKMGGRVVIGELFGDPHWVSPRALRSRAEVAGLRFERQLGTPLGYFARFARD